MKVSKFLKYFFIGILILGIYIFYNWDRAEVLKSENLENISFFDILDKDKFIFSNEDKSYLLEKGQESELENYILRKIDKAEGYYIYIGKNRRLGILDKELKKVTEPIFDIIQGLGNNQLVKVTSNNESYLLDLQKIELVKRVEYVFLEEEFIKTIIGSEVSLLGLDGREILPPIYKNILYVKEGLVVVSNGKKFGVIDLEQKQILPFEYDEIYFSNNNFLVKKDGKYYLNEKLIAIDKIYPSKNNVLIYDIESGFGLINLKTGTVSKELYEEISLEYDDYFVVSKDSKYGIVTTRESKPQYIYDYILKVGKNNYIGGTDQTGLFALIIEAEKKTLEKYEDIKEISKRYFLAKEDENVVLLNSDGQERMRVLKNNLLYYDSDIIIVRDKMGDKLMYRLEERI